MIVSLARTPIGKFGGAMSAVSGPRLSAIAVKEAVDRAGWCDDEQPKWKHKKCMKQLAVVTVI